MCIFGTIVESLLKDTLNKGHHRKYLPTKDTIGGTKNRLSYGSNRFFTSEEWTTSTVDKIAGPNVSFIQRFHCRYLSA